ncbi:uncharacterized protein LOC105169799 isoform X1 [Sesamum indicum]|uniref:Uncharacterized protein LOC105169799 isoform X1 n=1 Tax=Sesamum indicum TaxID=4182 RepID=A0A6I9TQT0_SESIN|nr:uncharacterized protein LOC105169799 isoform X1 [Sesamum indicum]
MAAVAATGGSSSHATREARRRRIVERGSERLALITGRIQSLPPDPPTTRPTQTPSDSSAASAYYSDLADIAQHEDVASGSPLPDRESVRELSQHHTQDETVEPLLQNNEKGRSITPRAVTPLGPEEETPAQDHQREQRHLNLLTAGQVYSAIAASEKFRICSSIVAAVLVILSYIGFPVLGFGITRNIIMSRPVYLLLLTNISIVLARVILGAQGAELRMGQKRSVPNFGGNTLVDQLGKALESALLLQNIFGALLMDFGIYTVVVICGLSVVQKLGW